MLEESKEQQNFDNNVSGATQTENINVAQTVNPEVAKPTNSGVNDIVFE